MVAGAGAQIDAISKAEGERQGHNNRGKEESGSESESGTFTEPDEEHTSYTTSAAAVQDSALAFQT